jgi:hypothetical protein
LADGQSQLILKWGGVVATPPAITTTAPATIKPNQVPACFTVDASTSDGSGISTLSINLIPLAVNGSGKGVDKSLSAQWTVSGNQVCITDSGGVGTGFLGLAIAETGAGAANAIVFTIEVIHPNK